MPHFFTKIGPNLFKFSFILAFINPNTNVIDIVNSGFILFLLFVYLLLVFITAFNTVFARVRVVVPMKECVKQASFTKANNLIELESHSNHEAGLVQRVRAAVYNSKLGQRVGLRRRSLLHDLRVKLVSLLLFE